MPHQARLGTEAPQALLGPSECVSPRLHPLAAAGCQKLPVVFWPVGGFPAVSPQLAPQSALGRFGLVPGPSLLLPISFLGF